MTLAKEIYRAGKEAGLADSPFHDDIKYAAEVLPDAGRFEVDQTVMDAAERMERTPFLDLLKAIDKARAPFPKTWIEWRNPRGAGRIGYLVEQGEREIGFAFRQYLYVPANPFGIMTLMGPVYVSADGWKASNPGIMTNESGRQGAGKIGRNVADIVRLLLILCSRSEVVQMEDAPDARQVDAARAKRGRPPLANLRPIRFNISRFTELGAKIGFPGPTTQREVAEHFVRGHFKLRSSGLFWWSPHVRCATDPSDSHPRDYIVTE